MFIKREIVLVVAIIAALVSTFFIDHPADYIGAIHFHTLFLLFALMLSVEGLASTGVFSLLAVTLVKKAQTSRRLALVFGLITCFAAMFLTNDVALLVFVPFAIRAFSIAQDAGKTLMMTCVIMTLGAIVGASLTPIGNPHNLYLYEFYKMTASEFFIVSVPMVLIGIVLIILWTFIIPRRPITTLEFERPTVDPKWKIYAFLLICCTIFSVLHLPTVYLLFIAGLPVIFFDPDIIKRVNYSLLLTFTFFFIMVENLCNIDAITAVLTEMVSINDYLASVIACQFISNVPASIALSPFSQSGTSLMVGTNVGGLGMIYGSMASLITFRLYSSFETIQGKAVQEQQKADKDEYFYSDSLIVRIRRAISHSYLLMWTVMSTVCLIIFIAAGLLLHW